MSQWQRLCLALVLLCLQYCADSFHALAKNSSSRDSKGSQAASPAADPGDGLLRVDVVVTDSAGRRVPGLSAGNFTLLENGEPNKILSFQAHQTIGAAEASVPVILMIDMLQLPRNLITRELTSVEAFLRKNDGRLAQPVSIFMLVESGLWQVAEASRDGNALAAQVAHSSQFRVVRRFQESSSPSLGVNSPWLEALEALGEIATAERRKPGKKLMLWVGPGGGVGSGAASGAGGTAKDSFNTICWFSALLREARITLYSISVGGTEPSEQYLAYLHGVDLVAKASFMNLDRRVLAVQSGGRALDSSYDLVAEMESSVNQANDFYTLAFDPFPAQHSDEYHDLSVRIDKPGLTAHTNTGYYDQPFYSDPPDPSIRQVTVTQLGQMLQAANGRGDGELAKQLSSVTLTERLDASSFHLATSGKKTGQALTMLGNSSVFLPTPVAEIAADPPPDANTQQHMISLVSKYLQQTIKALPNFYAARTIAYYQDTTQFDAVHRRVEHQPMHLEERYTESVLYRDGAEIADPGPGKRNKRSTNDPFLITYGTFGPVLGFVHDAIAAPGAIAWGHWEQSPEGPRAVFLFRTPPQKTQVLSGCCLPEGDGTVGFERPVGYYGEITIDPSSGTVLRVQAEAALSHFPPVSRSGIMVTYGPVKIGGKTYICPQKSISFMRTRSVIELREWDESFRTYGPWETLLNDVTYGDYHMFRGESHVMAGFTPAAAGKSSEPDSTPRHP